MDPLREDDIERARNTPPADKLMQALQMMETAHELKRAQLRVRHPDADEAWIEEEFLKWLVNRV